MEGAAAIIRIPRGDYGQHGSFHFHTDREYFHLEVINRETGVMVSWRGSGSQRVKLAEILAIIKHARQIPMVR